MMSAVQPFLSGAISKTVNVPKDCTVDDIMQATIEGWKLGLKALAIYRDGSKRTQPLNTGASKSDDPQATNKKIGRKSRRKLEAERQSITHKFSIGGHEGYITVGLFEDGTPGEIFIVMAKEGSTISGLMDSFATAISMALQYGVPIKVLIDKFAHSRFEPSGFTQNKKIPMAKSVMDYIFRWLATHFTDLETQRRIGIQVGDAEENLERAPKKVVPLKKGNSKNAPLGEQEENRPIHMAPIYEEDAPSCPDCGSIMVRNAACYKCLNCGATSGCS
jgi:ribonucleoside-diphosphate reductase alpha chain